MKIYVIHHGTAWHSHLSSKQGGYKYGTYACVTDQVSKACYSDVGEVAGDGCLGVGRQHKSADAPGSNPQRRNGERLESSKERG